MKSSNNPGITQVKTTLKFSALLLFFAIIFSSSLYAQKAKYVFLFIGDGMGVAHVSAADAYLQAVDPDNYPEGLSFTSFPVSGLCTTYADNRFITGSAAAGTALATGRKTSIGTIAMDPEKKKPYTTIAEKAKKDGFKVGIISSVSIDHATPASFYAHQPERNMYYEIALDLPKSGFDFFGGGGFKNPIVDTSIASAYDRVTKRGYTITRTKEEFYNLKKGSGKVMATGSILETSGAIRYAIDQTKEDIPLEDFVGKAVELLDNESGFFIMCEEGKIDWAAHENDARSVIDNVISLSNSVDEALKFYQNHPNETLIIITADHETGGLTLGSALSKYNADFIRLASQEISSAGFSQLADSLFSIQRNQNLGFAMQLVGDYFGLGGELGISLTEYEQRLLEDAYFVAAGELDFNHDEEYVRYGGYHPLAVTATRILNNRAGLAWTTWSHTGIAVPVFAIGAGADLFDGFYDNTDIPKKIAKAMGIDFVN